MIDLQQWWQRLSERQREELLMLGSGDEVPVGVAAQVAGAGQAVGARREGKGYTFTVSAELGEFLERKRGAG
jgi:hypothetical protein